MQDPITLNDFTKIARQLADQRLRSADVPPGQWSLDVLAYRRREECVVVAAGQVSE